MFYNWLFRLGFIMQICGKSIFLNINPFYLFDPKYYDYTPFFKVKMISYHLFRATNLDNLFVFKDRFFLTNWQSVNNECLAYNNLHSIYALKVHSKELNND